MPSCPWDGAHPTRSDSSSAAASVMMCRDRGPGSRPPPSVTTGLPPEPAVSRVRDSPSGWPQTVKIKSSSPLVPPCGAATASRESTPPARSSTVCGHRQRCLAACSLKIGDLKTKKRPPSSASHKTCRRSVASPTRTATSCILRQGSSTTACRFRCRVRFDISIERVTPARRSAVVSVAREVFASPMSVDRHLRTRAALQPTKQLHGDLLESDVPRSTCSSWLSRRPGLRLASPDR